MMTESTSLPPVPADHGLRAPGLRWGALAVAIVAVTTMVLSARDAPGAVHAAGPQPAPRAAPTPPVDDLQSARLLSRFALNALLAPLIDDDIPPRWTDAALHHLCGPATRVEIDGKPLEPGARVPATAFTVRWSIDECWPFDAASIVLTGIAELLVFHEDTGLSAVVNAQRLILWSPGGASPFGTAFAASLSLARDGAVPLLVPIGHPVAKGRR